MEDQYISFHCPRSIGDKDCGHFLGGISSETLGTYGFDVPWKDLRYCGGCRRLIEISIFGKNALPNYKILSKGVKINAKPESDVFALFSISEE